MCTQAKLGHSNMKQWELQLILHDYTAFKVMKCAAQMRLWLCVDSGIVRFSEMDSEWWSLLGSVILCLCWQTKQCSYVRESSILKG